MSKINDQKHISEITTANFDLDKMWSMDLYKCDMAIFGMAMEEIRKRVVEKNDIILEYKRRNCKDRMKRMWDSMWKGIDYIYHVKEAYNMHEEAVLTHVWTDEQKGKDDFAHIAIEWASNGRFNHRVELVNISLYSIKRTKFYYKDFDRFFEGYFSNDVDKRNWSKGVMDIMLQWSDVYERTLKNIKEKLWRENTKHLSEVLKEEKKYDNALNLLDSAVA